MIKSILKPPFLKMHSLAIHNPQLIPLQKLKEGTRACTEIQDAQSCCRRIPNKIIVKRYSWSLSIEFTLGGYPKKYLLFHFS
jgi:hypothetical protein